MARKKKGDSGNILMFIAIAALILIAVATPLVIIVGYFYNKAKALDIKSRITGNMSDFWLTDKEKHDFKEKARQLTEVDATIKNARESGEKAGIAKNQDGSFSARSNLGKELKTIIMQNEPILESLSEHLTTLQNLPKIRWEELDNRIKRTKSFAASFIAWLSTIAIYFIALGKNSISDIFNIYLGLVTNFFRDKNSEIQLSDGDIQMVAVATITAILVFFISSKIFKNSASKYTPMPEKVTLQNIDKY